MTRAGASILLADLALCGCRAPQPAARQSTGEPSSAVVPARAPANTPDALFDSLGVLPATHGVIVRSIVTVLFKPDATQAQKQRAVDLVHGIVVGGYRAEPIEEYYVRIGGTTLDDILKACAVLTNAPGVDTAFPLRRDSTSHAARPTNRGQVPALPPDSIPLALLRSMGEVRDPTGGGVPWSRGAIVVSFRDHTPQAIRQMVIDSIGDSVIGGEPWRHDDDGGYIVRIPPVASFADHVGFDSDIGPSI